MRGFGSEVVQSVRENMVARKGESRGGARDVPTSAPIETADGAKMCDDDVVESDAEALGATECDEATRPTVEAAPTVEELPAVDTAAAVDAAPQPTGRLGRHALVPGRRGAPRDGPGRRRGRRAAVRPRLPLPMLTADDALDNRGHHLSSAMSSRSTRTRDTCPSSPATPSAPLRRAPRE